MAQSRDCMEAFKIVVIYLKWINCRSYSAELPVQEKLLLVLNSGENPRISKTLGQTPQFPMVHICKPSFLSLVLLSSPSLPFLSSLLLPCSFFSKLLLSSSPHPCPPTLPLSLTHKHTHTLSLSFACNLLTTRVRHFLGHDCGKVLKHVLN